MLARYKYKNLYLSLKFNRHLEIKSFVSFDFQLFIITMKWYEIELAIKTLTTNVLIILLRGDECYSNGSK